MKYTFTYMYLYQLKLVAPISFKICLYDPLATALYNFKLAHIKFVLHLILYSFS